MITAHHELMVAEVVPVAQAAGALFVFVRAILGVAVAMVAAGIGGGFVCVLSVVSSKLKRSV